MDQFDCYFEVEILAIAKKGQGVSRWSLLTYKVRKGYICSMIELPDVTLVAVATKNVEATMEALEYSMKGIKFGAVKLISHYEPDNMPAGILYRQVFRQHSIDDWNKWIIYKLAYHIDTDFALLVHADGFVVNPEMWQDEWMKYDYIGAPWPSCPGKNNYRDRYGDEYLVGNSVSLRSRAILQLPLRLNVPWVRQLNGTYNEDTFLCVHCRKQFEDHDLKYAPVEVAKYFCHETPLPELEGITPFAFHKWQGANEKYPKFVDG
jgi:hypothetical protein